MIIDEDDIAALIAERAARVTNREERVVAALNAEPEYMKLIRRLSEMAGHAFSHLAYGDHSYEPDGKPTFAWFFVTDRGVHFMVQADGKAMMFNKDSREKLIEVAV